MGNFYTPLIPSIIYSLLRPIEKISPDHITRTGLFLSLFYYLTFSKPTKIVSLTKLAIYKTVNDLINDTV